MCKKLLLVLGFAILFGGVVYSQTGTIKGVVKDHTGGILEFANVFLKKEDKVVNYAMTNDKGEYQIFGIEAGTYDVEVDATLTVCKKKQTQKGVGVSADKVTFLNFKINCSQDLDVVEIRWERPVFEADNTTSSAKLSGADVRKQPGRSITRALSNMEGVASVDGAVTSVRGNRSDGQQTIIDGVRVRGGSSISMSSVEELELIQGGIPAEYGDGTSFTVITTKGVSKDFHGSFEVMGSLDGYNNFLAAAYVTGPILKGKKRDDPARIGFSISAEANYTKDGSPARGGTWRATDEIIDYLIKNPNRYVDGGSILPGFNKNVDYITKEDMYRQRVRRNADSWGYFAQGKIDFVTGKYKNITISINGSYQYSKSKGWGIANALFNNNNFSEGKSSTVRVYGRLNHRVFTDTAANAILKNIMYNINVNYTYYKSNSYDSHHRDNLFNYGHIGKFKTYKANSFAEGSLEVDGIRYYNMYIMNNIYDSLVVFDASSSSNPDLAWYTLNFVNNYSPEDINDLFKEDLAAAGLSSYPYNNTLYQSMGALLNGDAPSSSYGLFTIPGMPTTGYSKGEQTSIGAKANLSMNLANHEIKLGYEFDRVSARGWSVSPYTLWTLMRQSANKHISDLDLEHPIFVGQDTIMYNRLNAGGQTTFDRSVRTSLGLDPDGLDWIDIDNMDPNQFDIGMFSAEELLVGISGPLVSYYGYDYTGTKRNNRKTSIKDFFTATDKNGNKTYNIGAYQPVYMALYVQDKFSIQSLLFNVGLRIDRFDANQSVLADPYLFRPAYTAGEVRNLFVDNQGNSVIPANATDDWVVYVSQKDKTLDPDNSTIIGYRNGNTWYDAKGQEVLNGEDLLGANGGPILKEALEEGAISKVHYGAFKDYKPQWSFMPRISFSFPVSDKSLFYAHYNIITKRPGNLQLSPISYLFIEKFGSSASNVVTNPNMLPEKSIDYEIGFRQKIGERSAISLQAYYSEKRDQIQSYRYTGAYPNTYYSFANIDFGTVQGFSVSYNLRQTKNLTFRASYTLQFAKGTGSSETSGLAIISSGQPNLRTLNNLSFDQRHRLTANIDYHFGSGSDYNGPISKRQKKGSSTVTEVRWLQDAGVNIQFSAASGMPYSRSSTPSSNYAAGTVSQLKGSINGSNRPWIFQCDLRLDKSFTFDMNKNKTDAEGNKKGKKPGFVTVYLDILNLFNFKNIISVYEYTGNPDDDGYLAATEYQQQINSQVDVGAYIDQYMIRMQTPYNYSAPIRARLGIQFNF